MQCTCILCMYNMFSLEFQQAVIIKQSKRKSFSYDSKKDYFIYTYTSYCKFLILRDINLFHDSAVIASNCENMKSQT